MFYAQPLGVVNRYFKYDVSVSKVLFFMSYLMMASAQGPFEEREKGFSSSWVTFIRYTKARTHTSFILHLFTKHDIFTFA